jgi:hypothetical protein
MLEDIMEEEPIGEAETAGFVTGILYTSDSDLV